MQVVNQNVRAKNLLCYENLNALERVNCLIQYWQINMAKTVTKVKKSKNLKESTFIYLQGSKFSLS